MPTLVELLGFIDQELVATVRALQRYAGVPNSVVDGEGLSTFASGTEDPLHVRTP
jgi:hypothetical protein